MNSSTLKSNGLSGLSNLGNTCFINSCLQVLSHTPDLNSFLDNGEYKHKQKKICDSLLLSAWDDLRKLLWHKNCIISPNKFINILQQTSKFKNNDLFTGYAQNDLSEFLIFLIDCFHNSLSREIKMSISGHVENDTDKMALKCYEMIKNMYSKDYSEIWNLFYAIQMTELTSMDNKLLSMIPEPFFILSLPIPDIKNPSLIDCFNKYTENELMENENAWHNEETKCTESVVKRIKFWSLPKILIIDLKRYNNSNRKIQQLVQFPLENLDLSPYVNGYKKNEYKYDLYGVCNHSGSVQGGHYTSFVKHANNNWYHFNDNVVSKIEKIESVISVKAYCLFYRKV